MPFARVFDGKGDYLLRGKNLIAFNDECEGYNRNFLKKWSWQK